MKQCYLWKSNQYPPGFLVEYLGLHPCLSRAQARLVVTAVPLLLCSACLGSFPCREQHPISEAWLEPPCAGSSCQLHRLPGCHPSALLAHSPDRQNHDPKDASVLISAICDMYFITDKTQKGLCRCGEVKDLGMGRLFGLSEWAQHNHKEPPKMQEESVKGRTWERDRNRKQGWGPSVRSDWSLQKKRRGTQGGCRLVTEAWTGVVHLKTKGRQGLLAAPQARRNMGPNVPYSL